MNTQLHDTMAAIEIHAAETAEKSSSIVCHHGLGYNCKACYPVMPLPESYYRNRRMP